MRGQYKVIVPLVRFETTEDSVAGIIVPANTVAQLNRIRVAGPSITSNNAIRLRIRRFTGNTPTLSNANTPKAVIDSNQLSASVQWGDRGSAGTGTVWSATPTTPQADIFNQEANLFGGVIQWQSTLQESLDIGGQTSATYYDVLGKAGTQAFGTIEFVFTE
jgi:hypothetical protein